MQPQPGDGVSPLSAAYRPGPTMIVSPAGALAIPWVIDRHGLVFVPQLGPSTPLVAT
jgi:hypothetical protein